MPADEDLAGALRDMEPLSHPPEEQGALVVPPAPQQQLQQPPNPVAQQQPNLVALPPPNPVAAQPPATQADEQSDNGLSFLEGSEDEEDKALHAAVKRAKTAALHNFGTGKRGRDQLEQDLTLAMAERVKRAALMSIEDGNERMKAEYLAKKHKDETPGCRLCRLVVTLGEQEGGPPEAAERLERARKNLARPIGAKHRRHAPGHCSLWRGWPWHDGQKAGDRRRCNQCLGIGHVQEQCGAKRWDGRTPPLA